MLFLPIRLHDVVAGRLCTCEQCSEFVMALSAIERGDQRLHNANRAVISASIAPGFEVVSFIDVPVAELRGLVLVEAGMYTQGDLGVLPGIGASAIGRGIVNWDY